MVTITRTGPAAASELREGDRIVKLNDAPIEEPSDLSSAVLEHKPGDEVRLTVERGGDQRTIEITLGTRPDQLTQG